MQIMKKFSALIFALAALSLSACIDQSQFAKVETEDQKVAYSIGYNFGNGLAVDLTGQNIFDNKYRAFNNMPEIGRRILAKATYTFGEDN